MYSEQIFDVIQEELDYQDDMAGVNSSHVRDDLTIGEILLAIEKLVGDAKIKWYNDTSPHLNTRDIFRKIAALCVRAGLDRHGLPRREI